jgi:hypothetical protein
MATDLVTRNELIDKGEDAMSLTELGRDDLSGVHDVVRVQGLLDLAHGRDRLWT